MQSVHDSQFANYGQLQGFIVRSEAGGGDEWLGSHHGRLATHLDPSGDFWGQQANLDLPSQPSQLPTQGLPNISGVPHAAQPVRPKREKDWEDRRALITDLYWNQDKDLNDVINTMRMEHGFLATARQYKLRIKRWNIEKKIKTSEARAMIRIQKRRHEQEGKSTVFTLRERPVAPEKLERFTKRQKRWGDEDSLQSPIATASAPTPTDITYHTPQDLTMKSPSVELSPRPFETTSVPGTPGAPLGSFSPQPIGRTPVVSPGRGWSDIETAGIDYLFVFPWNTNEPTLGFRSVATPTNTRLALSPTQPRQPMSPTEHLNNANRDLLIPGRSRSNLAEHTISTGKSSRFDSGYVNVELSAQMHHSNIVDVHETSPQDNHFSSRKEGQHLSHSTPKVQINDDQLSNTPMGRMVATNSNPDVKFNPEAGDDDPSDMVDYPSNGVSPSSLTGTDEYATSVNLVTNQSPDNIQRVGSSTYATPMNINDPSAGPEEDSESRATPRALATYSFSTPSEICSTTYATPMQPTVEEEPWDTSDTDLDEFVTPKDFSINASSETDSSIYVTPMDLNSESPSDSEADEDTSGEIAIISSISVLSKGYNDELLPIDASEYEHSVKITAMARDIDETVGALENRLRFAAKVGDLESVEDLLDRGVDINAQSSRGMSALHLAAYGGHQHVLARLLENGAQIERVNADMEFRLEGRNVSISRPHPAFLAGLKGHRACAKIIMEETHPSNSLELETNIDILAWAVKNDQFEFGEIIIQWFKCHDWRDMTVWRGGRYYHPRSKLKDLAFTATRNGSLPWVLLFLQLGVSSNTVTHHRRISLLWVAAARGHEHIVDLYLQHGADINKPDTNGLTPLQIAILMRHEKVVRSLLDKGASVSGGIENCSNLHLAVEAGDVGIVQLLLEHGSDANACITRRLTRNHASNDDHYPVSVFHSVEKLAFNPSTVGWTPLDIAMFNGCEEIVAILLQNSANSSFAEENTVDSLVHFAADRDWPNILRMLLQAGANANYICKSGCSPLGRAVAVGSEASVAVLLEHGADPNSEGPQEEYRPPLHTAARLDLLGVARLLIQGGVDVNRLDSSKWVALHYAALSSSLEMISLMLESGADINIRNGIGLSALCLAATSHLDRTDVVQTLLNYGADPASMKPHRSIRYLNDVTLKNLMEFCTDPRLSKNLGGWHLIHLISGIGHYHSLESLLQVQENRRLICTKSVNSRKETPLHVAARAGRIWCLEILVKADKTVLDIPDSNSETPLEAAIKNGQSDVARELVRLARYYSQ